MGAVPHRLFHAGVMSKDEISMTARIEITKKYAQAYERASKKDKGKILDMVVGGDGVESGSCPPAAAPTDASGAGQGEGHRGGGWISVGPRRGSIPTMRP